MKKKTFNQILARIRRLEENTNRIGYYAQEIQSFTLGSRDILPSGEYGANVSRCSSEESNVVSLENGDSE